MTSFFSELAEGWEDRYGSGSFRRRLQLLLELVGDGPPGTWLDAGCGSGHLARALARRGHAVVGVDIVESMLEAARRALENEPEAVRRRVRFQLTRGLEHLEFADATFDGVLCSSVIEYVQDAGAALAEFHRVLRPGGTLVVSVPNRYSAIRNIQKILRRFAGSRLFGYLEHSVHEYGRRSFMDFLAEYRFSAERIAGVGPLWPYRARFLPFGGSLLAARAVRRERGG